MNAKTTGNTVRINGEIVFTGSLATAEPRFIDGLLALKTAGDVLSLRDAADKTLAKISVGDDGKLIDWLGNML